MLSALSDESAIFEVQVKNKSTFLPDACVGAVGIKTVDLLAKSTAGEAAFVLSPSDHDEAATSSSLIVLHLEVNDAIAAAQNSIKGASEDVRRSKIQRLDGISDVTQVVSGQSDLYKAIGDLLSRLSMFKDVVDAVSEIHPFLTIAWKLASALHTGVENVLQTDQKIINLVQMMIDASINGLLKQTIECCLFVRQYVHRSFFRRMLDSDSSQKIDEFERALASFKQQIDSGLVLHTAFVSMRTSQRLDDISLLQRLGPTPMDGYHRPECLPGTRTEIRTQIIDWMFSETKQNVFWLCGVAGSGKSTVSTTIANHFREMSRLGAFLFFERGKSEPSSVIRTIAYKLALFDSSIGTGILSQLENDKDIATASPLHQFRKLLLQPLLDLESLPLEPVMIVIDALDECGTAESRRSLMELFRKEFPKLPNAFRFLITSRQEADIDKAFSSRSDTVHAVGLDYTSTTSRNDVSLYLRMEMRKAVEEQVEIPEDWRWDENMELLGTTAGGLFIWASTAVMMVKDSDNPFYRLDRLVSDSRSLSWFGLDELYTTVLESSGITWSDARSRDRFRKVFALILLSKVALSSKAIDGILGFPSLEPSLLVLSRLRSLITYSPGGPVSLLHASFSDYLTSCECSKPWFIDIDEAKHRIVDQCFMVMEGLLRFNICDLETSFVRNNDIPGLEERVKARIPPHLEYVCLHWIQHLLDVPYSSDLHDRLVEFAHRRLLFWFEALSLIKAFGRVAGCALSDAASWFNPHDADVASFLQDASKLASVSTSAITESTPHIYVSVIPLLNAYSQVATHYSKCMASAVRIERRGVKRPQLCLKVLHGHSDMVNSVAFSPNGSHVASASDDDTIRVWDIESGLEVLEPLSGHSGSVMSVCFSPDGSRILSGSHDCTLRVWDASNGRPVFGPLEGHSKAIVSVSWSPDGTRLASGSWDYTIIIRDVTDGAIHRVLTGRTGSINSVAFSPDSTLLASGSLDKTIRIWDTKSGNLAFEPFRGHSESVASVAFSPNGKHLVSGSWDHTIKIWEVKSGRVISTLEGHMGSVRSVAYSPCGTRIVSGYVDNSVIFWDAESESVVGPLKSHSSTIMSVTFSPCGKYIASGSWDTTVRIWDAATVTVDSTPSPRHRGHIGSVAFSPNGNRIASASDDCSIIIWDAQTGDVAVGPLLGHTNSVDCVVFSSDGSRLFSGSPDKSIRIWDVETGESVSIPLKECMGAVTCIAISPDGATVACGFRDGTVEVWGTAVGEPIAGPLHGHSEIVTMVVFSSNGKRLASASDIETIILWDTETWMALSNADVLSDPKLDLCGFVFSVSLSPDGLQFASGLGKGTIVIWETENVREVAGPFQGYKTLLFPSCFRVTEHMSSQALRTTRYESGTCKADSLSVT